MTLQMCVVTLLLNEFVNTPCNLSRDLSVLQEFPVSRHVIYFPIIKMSKQDALYPRQLLSY